MQSPATGLRAPAPTLLHIIKDKGTEKQLLLDIKAEAPEGEPFLLRALVDTGAEASLIRRGMIPQAWFKRSADPLLLVTASGEQMGGGQHEVELRLTFGSRHMEGG